MFPPTLVKEDEALPETADGRMDPTAVLRWSHDEPVYCNPVLRSVNQCCFLGTFRLQTVNQPISLSSARFGSWPRQCSEQRSNFCEPTHPALGDLARGTARSLAPTAQNLS